MISGHEPIIGVQVYDILKGYGTIIAVEPDFAFTVKYGNDQLRFSRGGYVGQVRRIYWDNPIIIEPSPDTTIWKLFRETAKKMYAVFAETRN